MVGRRTGKAPDGGPFNSDGQRANAVGVRHACQDQCVTAGQCELPGRWGYNADNQPTNLH
ncbi:hypothetical protein BN2537_17279 [Streptomyces venezuelae]|nr:hypothetical protein BN2537_17279 [Streptomyces venezuelae]